LEAALVGEFHHGMDVIRSGGMMAGLDTFTKTAGRHGSLRHVVLGTPMLPPFPDGMETAIFAMGPFHAAERRLWQAEGVYTTAVGHAAGAEAVRVVFDPHRTSFASLLRHFWEGHDPTTHRSIIFCGSESQRQAAEVSRGTYQHALSGEGRGTIATEIVETAEFQCADEREQQYLAKHPGELAIGGGTGVRFPHS
jgi:peptide-methionine (S)-S-oxide reductase